MNPDIKQSIKNIQSYDDLLEICSQIDSFTLTTSVTRKLYRALKKYEGADGGNTERVVKIAYLGNITFEPLPEYVAVVSSCYGTRTESYIGGYDQTYQELINPASGFSDFSADIVVIYNNLQDLVPEIVHHFSSLDADSVKLSRNKILDASIKQVELALSKHDSSVLVANFPVPAHYKAGIADQKQAASEQAFYTELNSELVGHFRNEMRVQILDMEQLTSQFGKLKAYNSKLYYLAKVPWQEGFYPFVADQIVRHIEAVTGHCKKCLILDMDNTLWGGVLGEAGEHGIKVGHGDGESEAYYDFQSKIISLKNRGILLAACSKNNPEDIEQLFKVRADMPLKLTDFSACEISWDMKHEGIKRIARKLNIGLDSLVFIDDNPAECALIKQMLPDVATVLLPADPSLYPSLLDRLHGFDKLVISEDDHVKAQQYEDNTRRSEYQTSFDDLQSYLESLQTVITIRAAGDQDQMRAHQLFTKTNQFNLTTKRYSLSDIDGFINRSEDNLYVVRATDCFGDLGTIGLFLLDYSVSDIPCIDSFILSCRAMGRGIETAAMNFIKNKHFAHDKGKELKALFVPTPKNSPAESFYLEQGFKLLEETPNGEHHYVLSENDVVDKECSWINIR